MKKIKGRSARVVTVSLLLGLSLAGLSLMLARPGVVKATTLTVTSGADSGAGTLRQAIIDAASGDTINFAAGITTITLTTAELLINKNLTISGPGANLLTVQRSNAGGTPNFRIFDIASGGFNVSISFLTIANGNVTGGGGGGGIFNQGALTVTGCAMSGNAADGVGGGILNNSGTATITSSSISGNSGHYGGGIYNSGTATITNSTLYGNSATFPDILGGGGGIFNGGTTTIINSTVSGNSTSGSGGGIFRDHGTVNARNTIIAKNTGAFLGIDFFGTLTSQGYNLIFNTNDTTITGDTTGNRLHVEPLLGPFQGNGGPTFTQALLFGSPAIDQGHSGGSSTDQRGFTRPVDTRAINNAPGGDGGDIGAYEVQADQLPGCGNTVVTNNNDSGAGSLRFIIGASCPDSIITFASSVLSPITLTSGRLSIDKSLTISGPGANLLTVQRSGAGGTPNFAIFEIASSNVNLSGLTITNGNVGDSGGGGGGGILNPGGNTFTIMGCVISGNSANGSGGGGLYNFGTLTITNSTISGNFATGGTIDSGGGGILNGNGGIVTIINSTISGNSGFDGGGIYNSGNGTVTITNTTVSGNSGFDGGGGISNDAFGTMTITNSTISGNSANGSGGGIFNAGTVNVRNTIIAGNAVPSLGPDFLGTLTSQGFNLIGNTTNTAITGSTTGNQLNVNPLLDPSLQNNGGPTFTHALPPNSPAVNKGDSSGSNTDQRGFQRPAGFPNGIGNGADIGAYEVRVDQLPGCNTINLVVNNNNDGGSGSLRFIIANACPGSTIIFASNVRGVINLTSGELLIDKNLTIDGPGANLLTVQRSSAASGNFRIFHITSGGFISGLTIADGNPADFGGGIYNQNGGVLTVTGCAISGNSAIKNGVFPSSGGGIYNFNSTLTLINSTISGNTATGSGGGIDNNNGLLTVTNSTISGNFASTGDGGGGIYNGPGTANLTNSTISGNSTNRSGGGINNSIGTVNVRNTIIAGNTATSSGPDFNGALTSQDFNLFGNGSGATINPAQISDQIGTAGSPINPQLGQLTNNGGPTQTHALLASSTALNNGNSSGSATDQRGFTRAVGSPPSPNLDVGDGGDIGAFEVQGPSAVNLVGFTATARVDCVLLDWRTGFEVSNLGFYIQRDDGSGAPARITDLIAGSALFAGANTALTAGREYSWRDKKPLEKGTRYYLEEVDLDGTSRLHGPVFVDTTGDGGPATVEAPANSPVVSDLGKGDSIQDSPWPMEPKARLRSANPAALAVQGVIASQRAIKLSIAREGFYRITSDKLIAAGLDPNTNPRTLRLFVDGVELPIMVAGEEDTRFDATDSVEFYGLGLNTSSTDTRVYWLVSGSQPGLRINTTPFAKGYPSGEGFAYTVERRDRSIYFAGLKNGDEENFFGAIIAGSPVDQRLTLNNLVSSAPQTATIEVSLQGVTTLPHNVTVTLNGSFIGSVVFNGQAKAHESIEVPQRSLLEGDNIVTLQSINGPSDISLVDSIRVAYQHGYRAENDLLGFTAKSGQSATISGFSSRDIRVFDVTDERAVQELAVSIDQAKDGYAASITAAGAGDRKLFALTEGKSLQAADVKADSPSHLRNAANAADLIIISHASLLDSLKPLVDLRSKQGLIIGVVDIEDIYDEFSFGDKSPQAIKDFLAYAAKSWRLKPRFVLFAGDASVDPRNYLGFGSNDLVPTKLIDTAFLETASDDWLADFDGDGIADLSIGRLPVRTAQEASVVVNKLLAYEGASSSNEVALVADRNDGFDFEQASTGLRRLIPPSLRVAEIFRSRSDDATARNQLLDAINRGQKIVNYTGHGSLNVWRGALLTSADGRLLTNSGRLSLFVMMTCLNGYFQDAVNDSLAESLLKAENGGAVAVWASSALCLPEQQAAMNQELYRLLFSPRSRTLALGEIIHQAKASVSDPDIRRSWILLGDPTMRIR